MELLWEECRNPIRSMKCNICRLGEGDGKGFYGGGRKGNRDWKIG